VWFFLVLAGFSAASAAAMDFGLVVNNDGEISNEASGFDGDGGSDADSGDSAAFYYGPSASPWVSGLLGKGFSFYVSGRIGFGYSGDFSGRAAWREPLVLPELERTELTWVVSPSLYIRAGRQKFRDVTGLAVSGSFDGLSAGFSAGDSRISMGAWYTGFLYKGTANIVMTGGDGDAYKKPVALDEGYFASRRVLVSFDWEQPAFGLRPSGMYQSLALGLVGQFDLNGEDDRLHSQYLSARYGLRLPGGLDVYFDGVLGVEEKPGWQVFFAGGPEIGWTPAAAPGSRLSLGGL
jgi:hypothetical protein